jgi:hypothetical protein
MSKEFVKMIIYVFLRYLVFILIIYLFFVDNVKLPTCRDLIQSSSEDFSMFFWLFILPNLIEFLLIGIPMFYVLIKIENINKLYIYLLLVVLFVVEFFLSQKLYGQFYAYVKIGISIFLFILFFWKLLASKIYPSKKT